MAKRRFIKNDDDFNATEEPKEKEERKEDLYGVIEVREEIDLQQEPVDNQEAVQPGLLLEPLVEDESEPFNEVVVGEDLGLPEQQEPVDKTADDESYQEAAEKQSSLSDESDEITQIKQEPPDDYEDDEESDEHRLVIDESRDANLVIKQEPFDEDEQEPDPDANYFVRSPRSEECDQPIQRFFDNTSKDPDFKKVIVQYTADEHADLPLNLDEHGRFMWPRPSPDQ